MRMALILEQHGKIFDRYTPQGQVRSSLEALPLYTTVQSLAIIDDRDLAGQIYENVLIRLWENALIDKDTPYYLHNWLWFGRAFEARVARNHLAFFDFFQPINPMGFLQHFPWVLSVIFILLYFSYRTCHFITI